MRDDIFVKFEGGKADEHKIPAYSAVKSLYGVTRSIIMIVSFLQEGRVRHRNFDANDFEFNLLTQREGSFETIYELITDPASMTIISGLGLGVAGNFLHEFIRSIFRRSVGAGADGSIEDLERTGRLNPGDSAALVEAIEPAMKEAHSSIGRGARNILIINGDNNIVNLNERTRDYVYSSIEDNTVRAKLFSIGSFNANSGNGRAFDFEEKRTIPFRLAGDVDRNTIQYITDSISSYAFRRVGDNLQSAIALLYKVTLAQDGRVKSLYVFKARQELADL